MPGPGSVACPKPAPRIYAKQKARKDLAKQERECREVVNRRDKGRCVVPGCKERGPHKHHITYRSRGGKWQSGNVCSLCPAHHALVHAGRIRITGDADDELVIIGDRQDLAFKL